MCGSRGSMPIVNILSMLVVICLHNFYLQHLNLPLYLTFLQTVLAKCEQLIIDQRDKRQKVEDAWEDVIADREVVWCLSTWLLSIETWNPLFVNPNSLQALLAQGEQDILDQRDHFNKVLDCCARFFFVASVAWYTPVIWSILSYCCRISVLMTCVESWSRQRKHTRK